MRFLPLIQSRSTGSVAGAPRCVERSDPPWRSHPQGLCRRDAVERFSGERLPIQVVAAAIEGDAIGVEHRLASVGTARLTAVDDDRHVLFELRPWMAVEKPAGRRVPGCEIDDDDRTFAELVMQADFPSGEKRTSLR